LVIAGFTTIQTIVETVLTQANIMIALAEAAKPVAEATSLILVAIKANKFLSHVFLPVELD
jgi:hypothetical protein